MTDAAKPPISGTNSPAINVDRLRKADWLVMEVPTHAEAVSIISELHYAHGAGNTSTYRHGMYRAADWPLTGIAWGVALWIPPTRRAAESVAGEAWQGVLCLSRLVLHPEVPTNGASFLLGRSMRSVDRERWPVLLTYADTRQGHTGAIYKATNWECLGETMAGDYWVNNVGTMRGIKRGNRTMSIAEMRDAGFTRAPKMPKLKFVHRVAV